jgi:tetratricopeptide (TPR) repeat protein
MSSFKIQNDLIGAYANRIRQRDEVRYVDFNENEQLDEGEALAENEEASKFLEHVVYAEKNVLQIKKVYELVTAENSRTTESDNEWESKLILKAALVGSEVSEDHIPEYMQKFDQLFAAYSQYKTDQNLNPQTDLQKIKCLKRFLWRYGGDRYLESEELIHHVIDNQLAYLDPHSNTQAVGNCVGLTILFNIMAVRDGVAVDTGVSQKHTFSLYAGEIIENTKRETNEWVREYDLADKVSAYSGLTSLFSNRGIRYFEKREYEKSIQALQQAIVLNPDNAHPHYSLGLSYLDNQQYPEAIDAFQKAIHAPIVDFYVMYISQLGLAEAEKACRAAANAYLKQGQYREAIRVYTKLVESDSKAFTIFPNLAQAYFQDKQYGLAAHYYQRATQINASDANLFVGLGHACYEQGQYKQAISAYQKAAQLNPLGESFNFKIAKAYLKDLFWFSAK